MRITRSWLNRRDACDEGMAWFNQQKERDGVRLVRSLMAEAHLSWALWLLLRMMSRTQVLRYVLYAGRLEQLTRYDRQALSAVRKVLHHDTKENRELVAELGYELSGVYRFVALAADQCVRCHTVTAAEFVMRMTITKHGYYPVLEYGIRLLRRR